MPGFQPAIPFQSVTGYRFLQRTQERQLETFSQSPQIQRDVEYFRENIASVEAPQDLISDRRLLRVALTAFGLEDAVNQQALVRRVLEEGTQSDDAFANRLGDTRYTRLAEAFSFGNLGGAPLQSESFREDVIARFQIFSFEQAVGEVDVDQRLALNFAREAQDIAQRPLPDRTRWLQLLGSSALRQVIEAGFNLPQGFVNLDIDRQVEILQDRAQDRFGSGSPDIFLSQDNVDNFISRFFISRDVQQTSVSSAATALTLLTSGSGITNLVQSNF